jgi:hypothetical protein
MCLETKVSCDRSRERPQLRHAMLVSIRLQIVTTLAEVAYDLTPINWADQMGWLTRVKRREKQACLEIQVSIFVFYVLPRRASGVSEWSGAGLGCERGGGLVLLAW